MLARASGSEDAKYATLKAALDELANAYIGLPAGQEYQVAMAGFTIAARNYNEMQVCWSAVRMAGRALSGKRRRAAYAQAGPIRAAVLLTPLDRASTYRSKSCICGQTSARASATARCFVMLSPRHK